MTARKLFLILVSIIAPIILTSTLFVYEVDSTLTNPNFYINGFEEANVFDRLPEAIGGQLSLMLDEEVNELDEAELKDVIVSVLPPQWVKDNMTMIVNNLFDYLDGDVETIEGNIGLEELKPQMRNVLETDYPDKDADEILEEIPDNIDLSEIVGEEGLSEIKNLNSLFNDFRNLLYVLSIILLVLMLLLAKGLAEKMRHFGSTLIVPGVSLTIASFVMGNIIGSITSNVEGEKLVSDVLNILSGNFTGRLLLHGLLLLFLGIALIILSYFVSREHGQPDLTG
ncbi:MAG: hypothetical protein JW825_00605 [Candidatus Methanofastidiosa archaeon]|nr:hypothetical protein [Candidatus Methanofastidiosa archaeon]